jgi:hypothetical protein
MKKLLAAASAIALAFGLALIAVAAPASAHDSAVSATCSSLTVSLSNYAADDSDPQSNTLVVTIDGKTLTTDPVTTFAHSFTNTWPLDPATPHSYTVTVVAWDNYAYNVHASGTTDPCVAPVTPTFAEPSCTSSSGSYTIPTIANVVYSVGGAPVSGTQSAAPGSSITVTAAATPGYTLTGVSSWQHTFAAAPGPCDQLIAPLPPDVHPVVGCGTNGSLTLTPVTGVVYAFTTGSAGQTEGPYVIVASPAAGYSFANGANVTYSGTLGVHTDCVPIAVPPAVTDQSCTTGGGGQLPLARFAATALSLAADSGTGESTLVSGSIRTFPQAGVTYTIHRTDAAQPDVVTAGGVTELPPGTYTTTAHSTLGVISGASVWPDMVVHPDLDCVQLPSHALISGDVTGSDQACIGSTVRGATLAFEQTPGAIVYTLNGAVVSSNSLSVAPGTYTVTATPANDGFQIDGPSSWTVTVAAFQGACGDLTTLALPGADSGTLAFTGVNTASIGFLGLAGGFMIAGGILILRSRSRRRA